MHLPPAKPGGNRLAELLDRYLIHGFTPQHTARTKQIAKEYTRPFLLFLDKRSIATRDYRRYRRSLTDLCQEYINSLVPRHGYHSVRTHRKELARFFNWARRHDYISFNPLHGIIMPRLPRKPKTTFTYQEYCQLRDASQGTTIHSMIIIAWHTGMSIADCCLLTWEQVNLTELFILKPRQKTLFRGDTAIVPILPGSDLHKHLRFLQKNPPADWLVGYEAYVHPFAAFRYKRNRGNSLARSFNYLLTRLRLKGNPPRSFNSFRHSFCSALANSGSNTVLACAMTAHSRPQTFKQYVKPNIEALRRELHLAMRYTREQQPTTIININKKG